MVPTGRGGGRREGLGCSLQLDLGFLGLFESWHLTQSLALRTGYPPGLPVCPQHTSKATSQGAGLEWDVSPLGHHL